MSFFRKKKANAKKKKINDGQLDKEIIDLMEKLNIPKSARDGLLKLPPSQKKALLEQYKAKLESETTKPKETGKEWSDKFNDPKVDWKLLKQFEVITKDSDKKFAMNFIEELGLKRLCRVSRENPDTSFDTQILLILKAIIDTSQDIIKDIINHDVTIQTIAAKVDSSDQRVRELSIKLLVTLVIVEDDELSWIASTKIMAALLDSVRLKGYRNRWKCVLSHLSVNDLSGTLSFEYDNYALMLINFIISALETLEERTDERRLLNSLKFGQSLEDLSAEIDDTLRQMETSPSNNLRPLSHFATNSVSSSETSSSTASLTISSTGLPPPGLPKRATSLRPRRMSGHQSQLQQYQYCQSVLTQITAYNKLREEDLIELREEGVLDDENDLSSPKGLFKVVHDQALDDGYINELTAILKNLITIPASGDIIWTNLNKIVQSACAPTQQKYIDKKDGDDGTQKSYLSFKELQHLLKVQATDEEKQKEAEVKHNETQLKLNEERQKVGNLEKQVQDLYTKINQQRQTLQQQTEAMEKQYDEIQTLYQQINELQSKPAAAVGVSLGGLPPPAASPVPPPQTGLGGLPPATSPIASGLPPPADSSLSTAGGLPPPAASPVPFESTSSGLPPPVPVAPAMNSGLPPPQIETEVVEDVYATYRKMDKMKIPKRSICNKMKQAGISLNIIQKYELTGSLPPVATKQDPAAAPTAVTPAPIPTAVAVDDGLDKFRKMIKMKIPKRAIANKMKQSGVDRQIIARFEESGELTKCVALPPAPILAAPPAKAATLTKEEEARLAKYARMKKMKLPQNAIRNRMKQDGIDSALQDKFFGVVGVETVSAPVIKKKAKWPSNLQRKAKILPGRKMKNLQWTTVDPFSVEQSIWKEVDDSKIAFDAVEFENMFGQKIIGKKAHHKTTGARKKKEAVEQIHILDAKRSYNIEIFLGRLKMDPFAVKDALLDMNERRFNAEQVSKLKNFVPTTEEAQMFDDLEPNEIANLAKPESFFYAIANIDKNLPQRLELWAFKMNFDAIIATEGDKVAALCSAHHCIKTSGSLRELFSTILAFGNYMNGGTRKGCAHGFKLKSLSQLTRSRSTNNKVTLMQYLYLYLEKSAVELLQFTEEWKPLESAISVDIPTLKGAIAQIGSKLNIIEKRCAAADTNCIAGDKFTRCMKPFHSAAAKKFAALKTKHEGIMKDLVDLAAYLGEKNDRSGQFLRTLNEFRKQFEFSAKQCAEKKKREEAKKKREQWKLNKMNKKNQQKSGNIGLPPPILEENAFTDDMKAGLPPPAPPTTPNGASAAKYSGSGTQADQLLAALMRSDSTVLMNKLKARRKKNSVTIAKHCK